MERECKIHGLTEYVVRKDGRCRCKKCAVDAVQKRRDKVKEMAIQYKGGKCQVCGYDRCNGALEFHHLDPNEKDFGISHKGYTRSWEKVKTELDKCLMICANCHREVHSGLIKL
jgi:5-methylcytosine-specific restriction endonuclease McrA